MNNANLARTLSTFQAENAVTAGAAAMESNMQKETTNAAVSEILLRSAQFAVDKAASKFLKARQAVLKNKAVGAVEELKQQSRIAKSVCEQLMDAFQLDLDPEAISESFAGLNRVWEASPAKVQELANQHGIDLDQARNVLAATLAQAQLSTISQRSGLISLYQGWLSDLDSDSEVIQGASDEIHQEIERTVMDAYKRAGEWLRRDEGILIEGAAYDLGILLPKWKDVLPSGGDTAKAAERIRQAVDARAESKAQSLIDAARQFEKNDW